MEEKLKRGDVVRHKTLNIKMVVDCHDDTYPEDYVWCLYYDTKDQLIRYDKQNICVIELLKHDNRFFEPQIGQRVKLKTGQKGFVIRDVDNEDISVVYGNNKYSEYYNRNLWLEDISLFKRIKLLINK